MKNYPFSLDSKKILITGASSGIGRAVAIETSKLGATVILCARNEERLAETISSCHPNEDNRYICADLSKQDEIEYMIGKLPEKIDGVVHCAGVSRIAPIMFTDRKKNREVFDINFFSWCEITRLLIKKRIIKKGGSLVSISSISANELITPANGSYGASKAAMISWNKYCALEFAPKGIRVNSISPGMIDTPLIHNTEISSEELINNMSKYPLGRYGRPEDIAWGAIYLLSDASIWITGINLIIDGGITLT